MSVPIGWSYFVGWLVFVLYVTCGEYPGEPWEGGDMGGSRLRKFGGSGLAIPRDRFLGTCLSFGLTLPATLLPLSDVPLSHPLVLSQGSFVTLTMNISGV